MFRRKPKDGDFLAISGEDGEPIATLIFRRSNGQMAYYAQAPDTVKFDAGALSPDKDHRPRKKRKLTRRGKKR